MCCTWSKTERVVLGTAGGMLKTPAGHIISRRQLNISGCMHERWKVPDDAIIHHHMVLQKSGKSLAGSVWRTSELDLTSWPWISRAVAWEFWHFNAIFFFCPLFAPIPCPIKRGDQERRRRRQAPAHTQSCMHLGNWKLQRRQLQHTSAAN